MPSGTSGFCCSAAWPSLTTVRVPDRQLEEVAVRLALHRQDTEAKRQQLMLGTEPVVRESAAPPALLAC